MGQKIKLYGKVTEVSKVDFVGENKTAKQEFVLFVPGYQDQFDRTKPVYDEEWQITVFGNDDIVKFAMNERTVGLRCICEVFINSKRVKAKEEGKGDFFPISATLASLEVKG